MLLVVVIVLGCVTECHSFDRRRFPGPYCEQRSVEQCCPGRDDQCTMPIHDTLCYCDQFCAEHSVEDCCPDYEDICKASSPSPPALESKRVHRDKER